MALRSRAIAGELSGHGGMASVALSEDGGPGPAGAVGRPGRGGRGQRPVLGGGRRGRRGVGRGAGGVVRRTVSGYGGWRWTTRRTPGTWRTSASTLAEALAGISAQAPVVPFYSTVTGGWIADAGILDGGYWYRNLRGQVRFGPAVAELLGAGAPGVRRGQRASGAGPADRRDRRRRRPTWWWPGRCGATTAACGGC